MKNFGEKEAWVYPGTAQIVWVPPIISGMGKARFQILPVLSEGPSEQVH